MTATDSPSLANPPLPPLAPLPPLIPSLTPRPALPRRWWLTPVLACTFAMLLVHIATQIGFHSGIRDWDFPISWARANGAPGLPPQWSPDAEHALVRWDGIRYWQVATYGYIFSHPFPYKVNVSWFPLYPALGVALHYLTFLPLWITLLIISHAAAYAASIGLYRLTAWCYPHARYAPLLAVLGWLLQPVGVFIFAPYTESLFVLATVAFLYWLVVRPSLPRAVAVAAAASILRPTGVVFGMTLALVLLARELAPFLTSTTPARPWRTLPLAALRVAAWSLLSVTPFLAHAAYLGIAGGDPLKILHIQESLNVGLNATNARTALSLGIPWHRIALRASEYWNVSALENACALFTPLVLAAVLLKRFRIPAPMALFALLLWILPFFSHSGYEYRGMARYILATAAPLWILCGGILGSLPRRWPLAAAALPLLASAAWMFYLAIRFSQGWWLG